MLKRLVLAFVALLFAGQALAVTAVGTKTWRNITSIAVQATVTGDADTGATKVCQIFQRRGGVAAFDSGMVMSRRPGTYIWGGRILWADAAVGDTIDFYVETRGINPTTRSAVDTCTRAPLPAFPQNDGSLDTYANAATGDDANDGFSPIQNGPSTGPTKTITAAVAAMNGIGALDGTTVHVANGEYHENVTISSWSNGYHFRLLGASRDSTIICGANPNVEAGRYDGSNAIVWTDTGQDSCYVAYFPSNGGPADSTQLIVLGYGEYLHRKTSIKGILDDSTLTAGSASSTNAGELSGWFWRNDSLYVKRANGQAPSVAGNHFGYRDNLVRIRSRNWTIESMTIRYAGARRNDNLTTETAYKNANDQSCGTGCQAGKQNPVMNGSLIQLGSSGVANTHASGLVLTNLNIYGGNYDLISGPRYTNAVQTDSIYIVGCLFDGLTVGDMANSAGRSRIEEHVNAVNVYGSMVNLYGCTINGTYDGVKTNGAVVPDTSGNSWCEYSYSTFSHIADDAIDVNGSASQNTLILKNNIQRCLSGFNAEPAKFGPVYLLYNTFATHGRGAKLGGSNIAPIYWYHDTFFPDSLPGTTPASTSVAFLDSGTTQHNYFRNCLFASRATGATIPVVGMTSADSARWMTNEFNFNWYYPISGTNLATWIATDRSLAGLQTLGWEKNGNGSTAWGASGQHFQSPYSYNFRLSRALSSATDVGVRITGVNTAWGINRYTAFPGSGTSAPDMGAFEYSNRRRRPWWRRWYQHS